MKVITELKGFSMYHPKKETILKEKRLVHGMTQRQVAEKAKIGLQHYQKLESGERNIMTCSFQVACRVIEALGMDIASFYHGEYDIGEKRYRDAEGWKYEKTGKLVTEEVIEDS